MSVVSVNQAVDGSTAVNAASLNTNFNILANVINGNLDSNNLASSAVTGSKIAASTINASKIDWSATGASSGMWWEELGRTTLGSAGDTITVSTLPARKYLQVLVFSLATGGTINGKLYFNGDTGNNYSARFSLNGAADGTSTSDSAILTYPSTAATNKEAVIFITNLLAQEKLLVGSGVAAGTTGAANAPEKVEFTGKWANTAAQISSVTLSNTGTGDFAIGSEVIVLGHN